jgi:MYXO-CTERM domain-containing protein
MRHLAGIAVGLSVVAMAVLPGCGGDETTSSASASGSSSSGTGVQTTSGTPTTGAESSSVTEDPPTSGMSGEMTMGTTTDDPMSGSTGETTTDTTGAEPFCGDGSIDAGEACDDGDDNGPEGLCDADCSLRVSASLHALDWDHVCSEHIPVSSKGAVIEGLENGKTYNFVLVSYDTFGNPRAHGKVVTATPDEALPATGGDEGAAEGCGCAAGQGGPGLWAMSLVGVLGLARLRRR